MKAGNYPELRPGTRVDLLAELHAPGLCRRMFALARADHGEDHWPLARQDLERMLAVELPPQDRDQGPASGEKLRMLRAQALAETRRQGDSP
jgi:tRNA nucleotidyltransferase (CCA-adding enzyme)